MIYFIHDKKSRAIKIGFASKSADCRLGDLQVGNPNPLVLLGVIPGDMAAEKALHLAFAKRRLRGEWFKETTEIFDLAASRLSLEMCLGKHDVFIGESHWSRSARQYAAKKTKEEAAAAAKVCKARSREEAWRAKFFTPERRERLKAWLE